MNQLELFQKPKSADEMFCFAVYSASHIITRAYAPMLKALGLTYPQYITMTMLWEKDHQSVGDLCKRLRMESNTLTPLLKRVEALGLIKRKRDAKDERRVLVSLTGAGKSMQEKAPPITACMIQATGMTPKELGDLVHNLRVLGDRLAHQDLAVEEP